MTESKTQDTMYEYEKYIATPEKFREILNKFGVAIIPRVINEEQCANTISKKWDYFEHISQTWEVPINRNDKKSWKINGIKPYWFTFFMKPIRKIPQFLKFRPYNS